MACLLLTVAEVFTAISQSTPVCRDAVATAAAFAAAAHATAPLAAAYSAAFAAAKPAAAESAALATTKPAAPQPTTHLATGSVSTAPLKTLHGNETHFELYFI